MNEYLTALKDILIVLSPIIVSYISYRSNKKTKEDIRREIEKSLKEKDAETSQIIQKINAELESQKQISSWNNSLPQVNEYSSLAGPERYGNICSLSQLIPNLETYIKHPDISIVELKEMKKLLNKIKLPLDEDNLFTYEIPYIIDYKRLIRKINLLIQTFENES